MTLTREGLFVLLTLLGIAAGLAGSALEVQVAVWVGYAMAYGFGGWYGLKAGWNALLRREIEIDLLMIIAALGALAIGAPFEGALLLFLFSLSNALQGYALDRSRKAIAGLMALRPDTAPIWRDGAWVDVPLDEVQLGDRFHLKPGDRIPLDGVVATGSGAVDQAALTGESVPVTKTPGDAVFAGTINLDGSLDVTVSALASDSTLSRMIRLVEEAQGKKAATQRMIDRFEQPYVLGVLTLTALAFGVAALWVNEPLADSFYRAMTLLVAASPCALVISTPAAVLSAIAASARSGVLFKGGVHLETAARIRVVAFDKTGTLTQGEPELLNIVPIGDVLSEDEILRYAASLQALSEHPLARATTRKAAGLDLYPVEDFIAHSGMGVSGEMAGVPVAMGNARWLAPQHPKGWDAASREMERLLGEGFTTVALVVGGRAAAVLAYADAIRPEAKATVAALRQSGLHVAMLTGDHTRVAERIARELGMDSFHAELLPEHKVDFIAQLRATYGPIAMVGDGINDAPALALADLGIAMGRGGTDIALETADVVLMADRLERIPYLFRLAFKTRNTLYANFSIALGAMALMILAIFTQGIALPLAVLGHEGSTVVVSLNGLRLLAVRAR